MRPFSPRPPVMSCGENARQQSVPREAAPGGNCSTLLLPRGVSWYVDVHMNG